GGRANGQVGVYYQRRAGIELVFAAFEFLEAWGLHRHAEESRRHVGNGVQSGFSGCCLALQARLVPYRNFGIRNCGSARILHKSSDRAQIGLCECETCYQRDDEQQPHRARGTYLVHSYLLKRQWWNRTDGNHPRTPWIEFRQKPLFDEIYHNPGSKSRGW